MAASSKSQDSFFEDLGLPRVLLSQSQYAQRWGVSQQAVSQAIQAGRIPTTNGKIDPDVADPLWIANTDQTKPRNSISGNPSGRSGGNGKRAPEENTYTVHRATREQALAELAQMQLAEKRGELVALSEVRRTATAAAKSACQALDLIPDRISARLASISDEAQIHRILSEHIAEVRQQLSITPLAKQYKGRNRG